jgi:Ca2+/Na+ antiporter
LSTAWTVSRFAVDTVSLQSATAAELLTSTSLVSQLFVASLGLLALAGQLIVAGPISTMEIINLDSFTVGAMFVASDTSMSELTRIILLTSS